MANIGIIGYGKMGHAVESVSNERGHDVIINPENSQNESCDVFIEFTSPTAVMDNLRKLMPLKKPIVVGTTGWDAHFAEVKKMVEEYQCPVLYAANFSVGVNLFYSIVEAAAKLIAPFDEYDAACLDIHHNQKKDAPSGTAKQAASLVGDIEISSMRVGNEPGTTSLIFDGLSDTITITHNARDRQGYALGAVRCAEWLMDQPKPSLYSLQDALHVGPNRVGPRLD